MVKRKKKSLPRSEYPFEVVHRHAPSNYDVRVGDYMTRLGRGGQTWVPMLKQYPVDAQESDWGSTTMPTLALVGGLVAVFAIAVYFGTQEPPIV
jgi:hypothetical protein